MKLPLKKQVRYLLEAFFIYLFYFFFKALKIECSSIIAGKLLRFFAILLKRNQVMNKNLKLCFPYTTYSCRKKIISNTWQHFGSVIGELPHWHNMTRKEFLDRVKIISPHNIPSSKAMIISGHIGNWELITKIAEEYNKDLHLVYRPSNNPYTNRLINKMRNLHGISLIPKGLSGVRQILNALQNNSIVSMMVDQRLKEGSNIPFFHKNASTTLLPATIAIKYKIPIVMVNIIKTDNAKYNATFYEPLKITNKDTKFSIMIKINRILEDWIRQNPDQWFWFHNRWK